MSTTLLVNGVIMVTLLTEWFHRGQQKDLIPFKPFFYIHIHLWFLCDKIFSITKRSTEEKKKNKFYPKGTQQEPFDLTTIYMC